MFKSLTSKGLLLSYTLAFGVSLSTFVHADYYTDRDSSYSQGGGNYTNNNTMTNDSDMDLTKKIQDKIGPGWFSRGYEGVSVQVNNGNVTLLGTVKSLDEKQKLEKEIKGIDGVRNLNSQISVEEEGSRNSRGSSDNYSKDSRNEFPQDQATTSTDEQLNNRIRDSISRGWFWNSYTDVALNTNNGIVTLEGTVGSPSEQEKLIGDIQKIDGVRSVRNNLRISE